jgi:hypothetical protein
MGLGEWVCCRTKRLKARELFNVQWSIVSCQSVVALRAFLLKDAAPQAHPKITNDY